MSVTHHYLLFISSKSITSYLIFYPISSHLISSHLISSHLICLLLYHLVGWRSGSSKRRRGVSRERNLSQEPGLVVREAVELQVLRGFREEHFDKEIFKDGLMDPFISALLD